MGFNDCIIIYCTHFIDNKALDIYIPLLLKLSFEIRLKEEENTIIDVTLVCVSLERYLEIVLV
jgi:hypothetical protein